MKLEKALSVCYETKPATCEELAEKRYIDGIQICEAIENRDEKATCINT